MNGVPRQVWRSAGSARTPEARRPPWQSPGQRWPLGAQPRLAGVATAFRKLLDPRMPPALERVISSRQRCRVASLEQLPQRRLRHRSRRRHRLPAGAESPARQRLVARNGPALQGRRAASSRAGRADDSHRSVHIVLVCKRPGVDFQREKCEVQFRVQLRGGSGKSGRPERPHAGGLRRTVGSVNKAPSLKIAGALVRHTIEGFGAEQHGI